MIVTATVIHSILSRETDTSPTILMIVPMTVTIAEIGLITSTDYLST